MVAATKELLRMVRPGGRLAITTWGPDLFEPANSAFWKATREERPDLLKGFNLWERISTPAGRREMLGEAGIADVELLAQPGSHPISSPNDWWLVAMGSGYRGTLPRLDAATLARALNKNLSSLAGCKAMTTNVGLLYRPAQAHRRARRRSRAAQGCPSTGRQSLRPP
jgi:hypothetical protein